MTGRADAEGVAERRDERASSLQRSIRRIETKMFLKQLLGFDLCIAVRQRIYRIFFEVVLR